MTTQAKTLHDVNTCSRCKAKCRVEVLEGQRSTTFQCGTCGHIQVWHASRNYKLATA